MNIKGFYEIHRGRFILVFAMVTIDMAIDTSTQYLMTPAYNNLKNLNFSGFLFFLILFNSFTSIRFDALTFNLWFRLFI